MTAGSSVPEAARAAARAMDDAIEAAQRAVLKLPFDYYKTNSRGVTSTAVTEAAPILVAAAVAEERAKWERLREDDLAAIRTISDLYREATGVPPSRHQTARLEAMAQRVETAEAALAEERATTGRRIEAALDAAERTAHGELDRYGQTSGVFAVIRTVRAALASPGEGKSGERVVLAGATLDEVEAYLHAPRDARDETVAEVQP